MALDIVSKEQRKQIMSAVKSKNTTGEVEIRRRLHAMGLRYRLHSHDLPGSPDMVFKKHHAIVFIHGCFWHQHTCARSKLPKTNRQWWKNKLVNNKIRDNVVVKDLQKDKWRVLIIWECAFRGTGKNPSVEFDTVARKTYQFIVGNNRYREYVSDKN
ncbi:MAG TPA: very short patch repair endonuclease [Candidatus Wallbacteria bacterium]|nr:very short patch repair endonuclease [Candidatus Wallbacteria bacterium]